MALLSMISCAIIYSLIKFNFLKMANISVRKLDDEIIEKLRVRAARNGVSMEEEVRRILKQAVSNPVKLGDLALQLFGEKQGAELELTAKKPHHPLDLTK